VVADLDLRVEPGERVLLVGPSGAGKSTILRAAAGVLGDATEGDQLGEVRSGGTDPRRGPTRAGLLLQRPGDAVVAERIGRDVAFGPENVGLSRTEIWVRVHEALELVGLPYGIEVPTRSLSGGETQRLALAGALALRPGLLLLDEPTAMLDPASAATVRAAVAAVVAATGATLVVVEHRLGPWLSYVDRLVVLGPRGRLLADGDPDRVLGEQGEALAAAGVWVPGLPDPEPLEVAGLLALPVADAGVRTEDLQVVLRTRSLRGVRTQLAVCGVDLEVTAGAPTALTGRSGAGKSTLLAALGGLLRPTAGRVLPAPGLAAGLAAPMHRWRSRELAARVGWVPQDAELAVLTRSVRDEVRLTADRLGRPVAADALLEAFGLAERADTDPHRLSGGEQRRLAVLAGLAHGPCLALLDEPTVAQDRHTWAAVTGLLRHLIGAGGAVAVSTHDQPLVGALGARRVHLEAGRVAT